MTDTSHNSDQWKGTLVKKEILPANGIPSEKSTVHLRFALCVWWMPLFCGRVTQVSCSWRGAPEPKLLVPLAIWWVSGCFLHFRSLLFPSSQIFYMQSKAGVVNSRQTQSPKWPAWKGMEYPRKAAASSPGIIMEICRRTSGGGTAPPAKQDIQAEWELILSPGGKNTFYKGHSLQPQWRCATE